MITSGAMPAPLPTRRVAHHHRRSSPSVTDFAAALGEKPKVSRGQVVVLEKLEALPWNTTNGKSGVAFKAVSIRPASAVKAA